MNPTLTDRPRVLVVDDEPNILLSLEFLMKKNQYQVFIARNGREALEIARRERPDLVLLDIMMPEVDGYQVCAYLRGDPELKHAKVIFLSAKGKAADIRKGIELGADRYITKPFSTRQLMDEVKSLLAMRPETAPLPGAYDAAYRRSIAQPEAFWREQAQRIHWFKPPQAALSQNERGHYRWFQGGTLNTCYLAIDHHVAQNRANQTALIYDSPVTGQQQRYTYLDLLQEVSRLAGALKALGVEKGDTVVIYMPMIPQAVFAMLACARLGAVHSVVFGGFAPHELAIRIDDAQPKVLITASYGVEFDKKIAYKPLVDEALRQCHHPPAQVLVFQRPGEAAPLQAGRDLDYGQAVAQAQPAGYVEVEATDPLYILYTSGTTGKPKGIVRDNGGHAVALHYSMEYVYGVKAGEVFWAASDVGWVVGHSYIVYGPLMYGCATLLYEGKPVRTPDAGAFWRVIQSHGVSVLFTAPTAIRAIKKEDPDMRALQGYDLSSLRALFLAGERCDPPTLQWAQEALGVPVIDHWWQTESGWPMVANMRGLQMFPLKAGSSSKPVCGFELQVLSEDGTSQTPGQQGFIVVKLPLPPGCLPTLWRDDERFEQSYLSRFPGYYLTGDGGYMDEEGYVFIMGRVDDVINVAGHRLSTGEMEELAAAHPAVAECAVVGIADALRGQRPLGFVVLKDGFELSEAQLEQELVHHIREQIGAVAYFRNAVLVKRLPKTRSGKILRNLLRRIADGAAWQIPATIDDPAIPGEIEAQLKARGLGAAFEKPEA